jgi:hypothetical protein
MPNISFDGGAFELEDVQENPARYVARLERAKITPGFALCLCVTPPRQLVVRRYGRLFCILPDGRKMATRIGVRVRSTRTPTL